MGPFPFGGTTFFCPNLSSLPESRICLGNAFLSPMGGGGEESNTFEVIGYGTAHTGRMWEGLSTSHGGDFFRKFGY